MVVSWNGGTPSYHPFCYRVFHYKPSIGVPPCYETSNGTKTTALNWCRISKGTTLNSAYRRELHTMKTLKRFWWHFSHPKHQMTQWWQNMILPDVVWCCNNWVINTFWDDLFTWFWHGLIIQNHGVIWFHKHTFREPPSSLCIHTVLRFSCSHYGRSLLRDSISHSVLKLVGGFRFHLTSPNYESHLGS